MLLVSLALLMTPTAPTPPPPVPVWLSQTNRMSHPDQRVELFLPDGTPYWRSNPGPQTWLQLCPCTEVMFGGRRGGSKSNGLRAWMISGDPSLPEDDPARPSYINEPSFRGVFLRERYQDLREFIELCEEFYEPFGVKCKDDPVIFEFPSGATIYTGHLGDEEAFKKWKGWGIVRIGIEELTLIPKLKQYLKVLGSLRAVPRYRNGKMYPRLRTQIVSTTNPDGPGAQWVTDRFVDVYAGGNLVPWNTPMQDPVTKMWRIFIPAGLKDNPYLANDQAYMGMLLAQDPVTQKQWIEGDWHAQTGRYFVDYRPHGPMSDEEAREYPQARHLIEPVELKSWWYRWGSGDWGYDHPAAFHKYVRNQRDGRIHVYDELVLRKVESFEIGVKLAHWWAPELDELPDHQITLHLSPDAFALRKAYDEPRTRAQQIEAGIRSVLGPQGAFILHYNEDEKAMEQRDSAAAQAAFERRKRAQAGKLCIMIQRAKDARLDGWDYMKSLLRFRPIQTQIEPDANHLAQIYQTRGHAAYEAELARYAKQTPEVVPGVQIWKTCRGLDRCLQSAMHDEGPKAEDVRKFDAEDGQNGDDELDSCFIAGTMIETERGPQVIESIKPGERVWTRDGLRPVLASGQTAKSSAVYTIEFSDARTLTGTRNHPIWTADRGFTRLDSVRYGDIVCTWSKRWSSTGSNSAAIPTPSACTSACTIGRAATIASAAWARSIRRSGARYTEQFLRAITSITQTAIRLTTIPPTLFASQPAGIFPNIWLSAQPIPRLSKSCADFSRPVKREQRLGTLRQRAASGIAKTASASWLRALTANWFARNAGTPLRPSGTAWPSSAPLHASSDRAEEAARTTYANRASCAASPSRPTRLTNAASALARARAAITKLLNPQANEDASSVAGYSAQGAGLSVRTVATTCGDAPVYNLQVAGTPEYFANGILVHNCRMGLLSWKAVEAQMPKGYWVREQVQQIQDQHVVQHGGEITDVNRLMQIERMQQARYDSTHQPAGGAFTPPRAGSTRHRT